MVDVFWNRGGFGYKRRDFVGSSLSFWVCVIWVYFFLTSFLSISARWGDIIPTYRTISYELFGLYLSWKYAEGHEDAGKPEYQGKLHWKQEVNLIMRNKRSFIWKHNEHVVLEVQNVKPFPNLTYDAFPGDYVTI